MILRNKMANCEGTTEICFPPMRALEFITVNPIWTKGGQIMPTILLEPQSLWTMRRVCYILQTATTKIIGF